MKPSAHIIDIRPMLDRGEEPLPRIREKINTLNTRDTLTIVAPFLPSPLIELLRGDGFRSTAEHLPDGAWRVRFERD